MQKRNTWGAKFKRTINSVLPVDEKRKGNCARCGECCKLPNVCPFLVEKNGMFHCAIHKIRPMNCRKYPRTKDEHITEYLCGYKFE